MHFASTENFTFLTVQLSFLKDFSGNLFFEFDLRRCDTSLLGFLQNKVTIDFNALFSKDSNSLKSVRFFVCYLRCYLRIQDIISSRDLNNSTFENARFTHFLFLSIVLTSYFNKHSFRVRNLENYFFRLITTLSIS